MGTYHCYCLLMPVLACLGSAPAVAREAVLIAHWPLTNDARDAVGGMHGTAKNIVFDGQDRPAARFNGRDSVVTIPDSEPLHLGDRDFSLALWAKCETPLRNTLGDLVSKFDPDRRRGWNFHIAGSAPAYNGMSDTRHVHFGIDDGYLGEWDDCGKPWPSNSHVPCLIVFNGDLYCGIADADKTEDKAKVFRYAGGKEWVDCGRLGNEPNHYSVQSMVVHQDKLYAGTGIWDWEQARGQIKGLPPAAPTHVFAYGGGTTWRDLGQVGAGTRVLSMASFNDELYISLDPRGAGHVHKYDGEKWMDCGAPDAGNPGCLLPFGGKLYVSTRDSIYEYEGGQAWECIGSRPHGIEQIHCMQVIGGKMHLGTWPQGYVLRYAGDTNWTIVGRLGLPEGTRLCNEVNALTVYNGKLYAGVIPKAEFYRYEKDGNWTLLGHLAERPDWEVNNYPTWLRLTCLTMFQGRLFGCNYVLYCPVPPGGAKSVPAAPPRFTKEWFDRELLPEIRKRGLKLDMNLHNLLYWLPPDRYLADHPEWYALSNGQRGSNLSQLCICTSNAGAVRTLIDNVKSYLRENPEVKIVGVIPEDYMGMCQCDKCVAGDADPKAAFVSAGIYGENRSKSSRYHRLLRTVAEAVESDFPDVLVSGCAYADLLWPAPDVQLPENTTVWVALFYRDYARPLVPGQTSAVNQRFIDIIQEWKRVYRGKLLVYEYYMGRPGRPRSPIPFRKSSARIGRA